MLRIVMDNFGRAKLVALNGVLGEQPDGEGKSMQTLVFADVRTLTKQHAVDGHVVNKSVRVERLRGQERIPIKRLRVRAPMPSLAVFSEARPIPRRCETAFDGMVMGLERCAEFFSGHVGDEAPTAFALNQQLFSALEQRSCSALVVTRDEIIRAQAVLQFMNFSNVSHFV